MKGINFKEPLFNATIERRKTETRRIMMPQPVPPPQFRKRIKGFGAHCSWGNPEEELIEVPAKCPNISTGGTGIVSVEE